MRSCICDAINQEQTGLWRVSPGLADGEKNDRPMRGDSSKTRLLLIRNECAWHFAGLPRRLRRLNDIIEARGAAAIQQASSRLASSQ
jgi:hypothetical protein